jgi:predicted ATPase
MLEELGADGYAAALAGHRTALRDAFAARGGVEVDTQGDAFFYVFRSADEAVAAAGMAQTQLATGPVRVRMGIHTGTPTRTDEGYVGRDVHLAARIAAAAHGGQVVVSRETWSALAEHDGLTDLGEHRMKDFASPVWLYQLGADRFPPLKTISNTNLPRPVSSFVGREREIREVAGLLRDGARLVTLTGPGGTGKTRLAIEAATELIPNVKNGVFWIGLAPVRDPTIVLEAIGKTIGARDGPAEHIGEREMLLVVDNLEQVVEAAVDLVALLEACPRLRLLTTSRELLRVRGEIEYAVDPLPTDDGVALFCARAGLPADAVIAELCQRLDNLPLAIELAAARANALTPAQMLARLAQRLDVLRGGRDSDPRQQTLRSTIEWSYDLLNAGERSAFARLAVFRGGFTIDAAEQIGAADIDAIQALADRSLIRLRERRFNMLETIREFAAERLAGLDVAPDLARRHAEHFLAFAEVAEPHVTADEREWIDLLEADHDNIRAAFDYFQASGDGNSMQRMVGTLDRFWFRRNHSAEGARRIAIALAADSRPTAARASALIAGAFLFAVRDQRAAATEAMEIYRSLGDRHGMAMAEMTIGETYADAGDWQTAEPMFQHAVAEMRALGDRHQALLNSRGLAWAVSYIDPQRSLVLHEENLKRARELGNRRMEAITLGAAASIHAEAGRLSDALAMLVESHRLHVEIDEPFQTAADVVRFAYVLLQAGRYERAATLRSCAGSLADETGLTLERWDREFMRDFDERLAANLTEDVLAAAKQQGLRLTPDAAVKLALSELDQG